MNLCTIYRVSICLFVLVTTMNGQRIKDVDARCTSVIKKTPAGERQIVVAKISADSELVGVRVEISVPAEIHPVIALLERVRRGESEYYLEIPVTRWPDSARVVLTSDGKIVYWKYMRITPPRLRRVYDVQVSHHDLGYADYYHLMRRDVREMGIEMALDYCRRTDTWDKRAQFHWTVETSEPMTKFISSQAASVVEELAGRIREGRIELGGLHNSVYTEMLGYELMARLFYTPNRYIVDLLGTAPSRTALIDDVVGFSRTLPLFLKEADIPYFYHGYNETINGLFPASANPVFYWKANDGDGKSMPLFRSFPYYSPDRLTKYDLPEIAGLLDKYDADPRWGYDCLIAEDSYDFSVPHFENVEGIRSWNEHYSNPALISGTFSMFFDDVLRQRKTASIPVYDEDAPNAWADEDGSDARLMAEARMLNFDLPTIEKLSTLVYASGGKGYPWKELWQSYHKLLTYHEHTDGAFSEEDVSPIPLQKERKAANANYYECEQVLHKGLVKEARLFAEEAKKHSIEQFKRLIQTTHDNTVVVFNPLSVTRSDLVKFPHPSRQVSLVRDNMTGKDVPSQILPGGELLFAASDIPSLGYRTYRLISGKRPMKQANFPSARGGMLENEYYRIRVDSITGALASLYDKRRSVELVDQGASYGLNEYIYQRIDDPSVRTPTTYLPRMASLTSFNGELAAGITARLTATGCTEIEQTTILYANSDRIDVVVRLNKTESGRLLKQTSSENKEALFCALPFAVPDFTIHHELAGGVVEPLAHQFQGSTSNYFAIQHFTDVSNQTYGVTLSTINAPLVEYGNPRPALWLAGNDAESIIKKPNRSHVYLYLMNNMFFTNIPVSQPGEATFRWSLRVHDGNWLDGKASRFGWETSHPCEAFLIEKSQRGVLPIGKHSFLSIDRDNVVCTTVKPAEANGEGFILRFFELSGTQSDVRVRANLFDQIRSSDETNLVEVDRNIPLTIFGKNEIVFSIRPFGVKTIRIVPVVSDSLPSPSHIAVRPLSDREVSISWKALKNQGISFYRVFRGTRRDFTPALINCMAMVTATGYTDAPMLNYGGWLDNKLEPGQTYFYRVEAVGRFNNHSKPSDVVEVRTLVSTTRNSIPSKVVGLEATNVSPLAEFNYICLLFYTNCESDVSRYRVYRGESPGFRADTTTMLSEIDGTQKFKHVTPHGYASVTRELRDYAMIVYPDESTRPNRRYYYRVCAVDEAGQAGELSEEVTAMTEVKRLHFEGSKVFYDSSMVDIRPVLNDGSQIRYTLDGSEPTLRSNLYRKPFVITEATTIKAAFFPPGLLTPTVTGEASFRRSLYPPPRYLQPFSEKWPGEGELNLVDGKHGTTYADGFFQGFEYNDMDVVVDLGGEKKVQGVSVTMLQDIRSWIFLPEVVEFFVSHDGTEFEKVGDVVIVNDHDRKDGVYTKEYALTFVKRPARFVRVRAKNVGMCPPWHIGYEYKGKAWIFADEIDIR